mmetsp:Transcript_18010/g.59153  ORF Transcript_18010/g.59153 Transcript_18010/m.59153 type:complete len:111 (+) Transcript_18010:272-604(+)
MLVLRSGSMGCGGTGWIECTCLKGISRYLTLKTLTTVRLRPSQGSLEGVRQWCTGRGWCDATSQSNFSLDVISLQRVRLIATLVKNIDVSLENPHGFVQQSLPLYPVMDC